MDEHVIDLKQMQIPAAPFIQPLNGQGYTFPQPREAILNQTLQVSRSLLDAADELLKEAQSHASKDRNWVIPPYNPSIIEEQQQAHRIEQDQFQAQALERSQPIQTLSLAMRLAQQAGKTWEDLPDYEREILTKIEEDQREIHANKISIGH